MDNHQYVQVKCIQWEKLCDTHLRNGEKKNVHKIDRRKYGQKSKENSESRSWGPRGVLRRD